MLVCTSKMLDNIGLSYMRLAGVFIHELFKRIHRVPNCEVEHVAFSVFYDWSAHLEKYILLKTPPQLNRWFQSYEQLKDCQQNKKNHSFLATSHNQCSRLLTDSARAQHILSTPWVHYKYSIDREKHMTYMYASFHPHFGNEVFSMLAVFLFNWSHRHGFTWTRQHEDTLCNVNTDQALF